MSKAKHAGGRPTKYKKEYCDGVIKAMSQGSTLVAFAQSIGVNTDTIHEWRKKYPQFSDSIKKAEEASMRHWEAVLERSSLGKKIVTKDKNGQVLERTTANPLLLIFLMKARFRNKYGDQVPMSGGSFEYDEPEELESEEES